MIQALNIINIAQIDLNIDILYHIPINFIIFHKLINCFYICYLYPYTDVFIPIKKRPEARFL